MLRYLAFSLKRIIDLVTPCPPGMHVSWPEKGACINCAPGRYNHGGMAYSRDFCYTPVPPEFEYVNATAVRCGFGYTGHPFYEDGEYEEGCLQKITYPTLAPVPTSLPSFIPTLAPVSLPPVCIQCFDILTNKTSLPTLMPTAMDTFSPSPPPTNVVSPPALETCSHICCWVWTSVFVILLAASSGYICYRRTRIRSDPILAFQMRSEDI